MVCCVGVAVDAETFLGKSEKNEIELRYERNWNGAMIDLRESLSESLGRAYWDKIRARQMRIESLRQTCAQKVRDANMLYFRLILWYGG